MPGHTVGPTGVPRRKLPVQKSASTQYEVFPGQLDLIKRNKEDLLKASQPMSSLLARPSPRPPEPGVAPSIVSQPKPGLLEQSLYGLASVQAIEAGVPLPSLRPVVTQAELFTAQQTIQQVNERQINIDTIMYKGAALIIIPALVESGSVHNVAEALAAMPPGKPEGGLTYEIRVFMEELVNSSIKAGVKAFPEPLPPDEVERLSAQREPPGLHGLIAAATMQDYLRQAVQANRPQLPEGMTDDEWNQTLIASQFTVEQMDEFRAEAEEPLRLIVDQYLTASNRLSMMMSEFRDLEVEELVKLVSENKLQAMMSRPALGLLIPVEWWMRNVARAGAGALTLALGALREGTRYSASPEGVPWGTFQSSGLIPGLRAESRDDYGGFGVLYDRARWEGESIHEALIYGFENSSMNGFQKFVLEILGDPLSYWGWGAFRVFRPYGALGRSIAGAEDAWIRTWDSLFIASKNAVSRNLARGGIRGAIPGAVGLGTFGAIVAGPPGAAIGLAAGSILGASGRTITQHVGAEVRASMQIIKAGLESAWEGTPLRNLSATQIRNTLRAFHGHHLQVPFDSMSLPGAIGGMTARQMPVSPDDVLAWGKRLGASEADLLASSEEYLLSATFWRDTLNGIGHGADPMESAEHLVKGVYHLVPSPTKIDEAISIIRGITRARSDKLEWIVSPDRSKVIFDRLFKHNEDIIQALRQADVTKAHGRFAALTNWVSNAPPTQILAIGNRLSMSVARTYLMFAFYAPWNMAETVMKTVFRGLNPFYRGSQLQHGKSLSTNLTTSLGFLSDDFAGVTAELGYIRAATRISIPKLTGMSTNTYERLLKASKNSFGKTLLEVPERLFIKTGGRVGIEQQANFLVRGFDGIMRRKHIDIYDIATALVEREAFVLRSSGMDEKMVRQIVKEAEERLIHRPEQVANLPVDFTPQSIDSQKVAELITKYDALGPHIWDLLLTESDAGRLLPAIDRLLSSTGEAAEVAWQTVMNHPQILRQQTKNMVDAAMQLPPRNLEELRYQVHLLNEMTDMFTGVIDEQIVTHQQYGQRLRNLEHKNKFFDEMWGDQSLVEKDIARLTEDEQNTVLGALRLNEKELEGYVNYLRGSLREVEGISVQNLDDYNKLLTEHLTHYGLLKRARETQRAVELELLPTKPGRGTPKEVAEAWWTEFYARRSAPWAAARDGITDSEGRTLQKGFLQSGADLIETGNRLELVILPAPFRVSGRLTPADVSALYISIPQDLQRALYIPELGTFKSKQKWTAEIYARAKKVSQQTKQTPEELGFGKDNIELVYDLFMQQLKGSTAADNLLKPTLDSLDLLRRDVRKYAARKGGLFPKAKDIVPDEGQLVPIDPDISIDPFVDVSGDPIDLAKSLREELKQQLSETSTKMDVPPEIWKELDLSGVVMWRPAPVGTKNLGWLVEEWFHNPMNEVLQALGKTAAQSSEYRNFVQSVLRKRFESGYIKIHRGQGSSKLPLNREYTNVTADRQVAREFEPWPTTQKMIDSGVDEGGFYVRRPSDIQIDSVTIRIEDVLAIGSVDETELIIRSDVLRDRLASPLKSEATPIRDYADSVLSKAREDSGLSPIFQDSWTAERQSAWNEAEDMFRLTFPDYDNVNAMNQTMKGIFPFFTYETHRPYWLAQTIIEKPGVATAWGKYQNYSDNGYIAQAGSWQINPLRGFIFMGGGRRLITRDFPEFYDEFPEVSNAFDQFSRWGFYPNILVGAFLSSPAAIRTGRTQFGELLPPIPATILEAMAAVDPTGFAAKMFDTILGSRFRDYNVAQAMGDLSGPAGEILSKVYGNIELTDDEKKEWAKGQRGAAKFNLVNLQIGLMRMRPQERVAYDKARMKLMEQETGITILQQKELQRFGLTPQDFLGGLHPTTVQLLNDQAGAENWRGITSYLGASEMGRKQALVSNFYDQIRKERELVQPLKEAVDRDFLSGVIVSHDDWRTMHKELDDRVVEFRKALKKSDTYKTEYDKDGNYKSGIPIEMEDRKQYALMHGEDPLILHPVRELINLYFQKQIEIVTLEDGTKGWNYEEVYLWRALIELSLPEGLREELLTTVRKWDSTLEKKSREDYDNYMRPYLASKTFILSGFSEEEQRVINEFNRGPHVARLGELREVVGESGNKVVSEYQSKLRSERHALRLLDPSLDARLALWGVTQSVLTVEAETILAQLRLSYGFRS